MEKSFNRETTTLANSALGTRVPNHAKTNPQFPLKKGPSQRIRKSQQIARIGNIEILAIPGGMLTDLSRFDSIVVPTDEYGSPGQFLKGLQEENPDLGKHIYEVLARRQQRGRKIPLAENLKIIDGPLIIAVVGNVYGLKDGGKSLLASATRGALRICRSYKCHSLLFPLLSVGSGGASVNSGSRAFVLGLLKSIQEFPVEQRELEVHICTRNVQAMKILTEMLRKEAHTSSPESPNNNYTVSEQSSAATFMAMHHAASGYLTDSLAEEPSDFVGVGAEILAFARLAASREIEPPLAIGVFGDWGTGKSFFMNSVRRKIEELGKAEELLIAKSQSDKRSELSGIHTNVVQIEFNAWHYIETNLWASLVEYIFSRLEEWLRAHNEGNANNGSALFESLATSRHLKLDTARSVMSANAELNAARKAAVQAELDRAEKLKSKKAALNAFFCVTIEEVSKSEDFAKIRNQLAILGLAKVNASNEELQKAITELRQTGSRSKLFWEAVRAQTASPHAWLGVLSLLVVPVVISSTTNCMLGHLGAQTKLTELLTGTGAVLMTAAGLVKALIGKVKPALDQAERFAMTIRERMASFEAESTRQEQTALAKAQEAADEAEKRLAAAQERLRLAAIQAADAQNSYIAESARGRLNRFIRERLADGTYGRHLGLIATIRKDFEQLTALVSPLPGNLDEQVRYHEEEKAYRLRVKVLIEEATTESGEDLLGEEARKMLTDTMESHKPPHVFERIVLYIDDLDRCPPERVVEVLQAVHMLLSFRLFVVFVAVDARWVTCALRQVYDRQLSVGNGSRSREILSGVVQSAVADMATAEDYMEKIFQIPYWVRPMEESSAGEFMRKLVQSFGVTTASPDRGKHEPNITIGGLDSSQDSGPELLYGDTRHIHELRNTEVEDDKIDITAEEASKVVEFARAAKLELLPEDFSALNTLAPVVGGSPRRIKRFLNTYLLIQSIVSVAVNGDSADIDAETSQQMRQILENCSYAQQSLALATSLALTMQEELVEWLNATMLADISEEGLTQQSSKGNKLPAATNKVLTAYITARKYDKAYSDGYRVAFSLFLPIAHRYGFHERKHSVN